MATKISHECRRIMKVIEYLQKRIFEEWYAICCQHCRDYDGLTKMNEEISEKVLRYETFINDVLKEDLKKVHDQLERKNTEVAEWVQLKTVLNSFIEADMTKGFKTKMDIGTNVYVQVNVPDASKILINVGSGIYVEYTIQEALNFIEKRIDLLNKQIAIIKTNSAEIKARIKLVLHGIQELSNIK